MKRVDGGRLGYRLSKIAVSISLRSPNVETLVRPLKAVTTIALMFLSVAVQAEETVQASCTKGDLVRRVAVTEHSVSTGLSCEVVYWKETEAPGKREVLWTAKQDAGYCYSKAIAFASKLTSLGWSCPPFK